MPSARILHLIDPASPGGGACTLRFLGEAIAHLAELEHDVIIVGSRAHGDLARRCGVVVDGVVCPPLREPWLARRALARAVARREAERGRYDRVHAWTLATGVLAGLALPGRRRIVTPTVGALGAFAARLARSRPAPVFAASEGVADACRAAGMGDWTLSVLPPAVNGAGPGVSSRAELREAWGVPGEEPFVVAVFAEPTAWADALLAVRIAVRMAVSQRRVDVVVHHGAAERVAAERWVRAAGYRARMIVDDAAAEPWRVLPGADAALVLTAGDPRDPRRPESGMLPLLQAMSAGVPVMAEETAAVRAMAGEDEAVLIVPPRDVNGISAAIARLYDDREAARRLGAAGAARARAAYGFDAYRAGVLAAYGLA